MNTMYRELRGQGGMVCRVIDPRSEHGCDDSRFMSINFFDAVLFGKAVAAADRDTSAPWLPNDTFAALWREFSETGTLRPAQPPRQAPDLRVERMAEGGARLTWRITPELAGGLRGVRILRDGQPWRDLAAPADSPLATSRDATPEALRPHGLVDEEPCARSYTLLFLDAAGGASPVAAAP